MTAHRRSDQPSRGRRSVRARASGSGSGVAVRPGDRAARRSVDCVRQARSRARWRATRSCSSSRSAASSRRSCSSRTCRRRRRRQRVRRARRGVAVVHRAVRQLRRSGRRGPGQGPGRHAAQDPVRDGRARASARRHDRREGVERARRSATSASSTAGELIPGDGEIIEGIASVDESAITGESAPVIRESGGDRSAVTGGTRVLSDQIVVRITSKPGRDLPRPHDRARRRRQPAEDPERDRAQHPAGGPDDHLPAGRRHAAAVRHLLRRASSRITVLVALLVCLIPTTIGALLSAIGIAGMDRLVQRNVLAMSGSGGRGGGRLLDAAARQDRHDHLRQPPGRRVPPVPGVDEQRRWPTPRCSRAWPTRRPKVARS